MNIDKLFFIGIVSNILLPECIRVSASLYPSELGSILQRHRTRGNSIYLDKELAEMIIEAEKCHDLLSKSWKPGQASGVVIV